MKTFLIIVFLTFSLPILAHSGKLNATNCHYNKKDTTYHCHNKKNIKYKATKHKIKKTTIKHHIKR